MIHIDSDEDNSRTESPPPPSDDEDFWPEHSETAYRVYHDLWMEFYSWEREHCQQTLYGLSKVSNRPPSLPNGLNPRSSHSNIASGQDAEWFTIHDYDPTSSASRILRTTVSSDPTRVVPSSWQPYPRYSACTPASRSVVPPLDLHLRAHFAPYADDERFELVEYLEDFEDFMWQNNFTDPDLEMIQLETARRLYYTHEFSFSDIDRLKIFAFHMRESGSDGLIWYSAQRDFLRWPGSDLSTLEKLPTNFVDFTIDLYENVTRDLTSFCPGLNCLRSFCDLHGDANPIFPPKPTVTNRNIADDKVDPCPNDCYKSMEAENMNMINNHWDDAERAIFNSVVRLAPDTHPCDLAVICRKPCFEMYIQRLNFLSDEDMVEPEPEVDAGAEKGEEDVEIEFEEDKIRSTDEDKENRVFSPVAPCYHEGPCNQFSLCHCYKSRQRCQRSCRCAKTCKIRWKGCNCNKNRPCGDSDPSCPCRERRRECDPELCVGCGAQGTKPKCLNTDLQKARFHRVEIKKSQYGLGAFAVKAIPFGAYIGEYVGEQFSDEAYLYMDRFHKFTGLNYGFDRDRGWVLDSWSVGNETRYLDHSTTKPNAHAQVLFVHGEHRIVLYALDNILAGEELLLNYGPGYWHDNMPN